MKKTFLILLTALFFLKPVFSENKLNFLGSSEVFELNLIPDTALLATGLAMNGAVLLCDHVFNTKNNKISFDGTLFNKNDVNGFDRNFMNPYNKVIHKTANLGVAAALISPVLFAAAPSSEWFTIGTLYAETILIANGIKDITKLFIDRPRPYMYFDGYPQEKVDAGDWAKSFPSGHTTMVFTAAAFNTFVFSKYFPDSPWKYAVAGGSYALAATVGIMRLLSGNHFLTDVLAGAALGSLCGYGIPYLHTINTGKSEGDIPGKINANISPIGFSVGFSF